MEIIEVDPQDQQRVRDWHAVYQRSQSHERAFANPWQLGEVEVELRNPGRRRRLVGFAGVVDGTVVTSGAISLPQLDNRDTAVVTVDTDPALRRRGHGGEMLAHLEAYGADHGRTMFNAETFYPYDGPADGHGHDNADFLTHRGFVFGLGDVHRWLELPVDPELLDRMIDEAAPHHPAYRIRTWSGGVPADLVVSFATIFASLMTEAPTGEVHREPEAVDVEAFLEEEELRTAQGRVPHTAVALDASGDVVAFTMVMTTSHEPGRGYQWGTVVARAHRGHRLGMAVKAANLRAAQQRDPLLHELFTYNAEVNAHMVAINDALGFRPVERLGEFQKRV